MSDSPERTAIYEEMANIIHRLLVDYPDMSGIWHVASDPISKYDLLTRLSKRLDRNDIEILPDDSFVCDRSLKADRFNTETGYVPPGWDQMIDGLAGQIESREA